jgi:hypothetical protein
MNDDSAVDPHDCAAESIGAVQASLMKECIRAMPKSYVQPELIA